ncbi:phosphatidate phosphatase PAH1 isoform X1 [Carex littledalei]|uniref:phosphatidate phosphatase n=1 Tax=Carex littledalei TaxID=544730 RepID=A0A833QFZ0_9POAL|nr:phosphatidate phosphatase PAH1 isoform X1 [Carex littledalei]
MNVVGKVGSLISQGVYSVATPFHPFGGAVDVVVVQQEDGTYRSTPWYVRFGKFQGVLKGAEKVVTISVNGVEAPFHMYLDNSGQAYFMREVVPGPESIGEPEPEFFHTNSIQEGRGEESSRFQEEMEETMKESNQTDPSDLNQEGSDEHSYGFQPGQSSSSAYQYGSLEEVEERVKESNGSNSEVVLISIDGHVLTAPINYVEETTENLELNHPQFHLGPGESTSGDFGGNSDVWEHGIFELDVTGNKTVDVKEGCQVIVDEVIDAPQKTGLNLDKIEQFKSCVDLSAEMEGADSEDESSPVMDDAKVKSEEIKKISTSVPGADLGDESSPIMDDDEVKSEEMKNLSSSEPRKDSSGHSHEKKNVEIKQEIDGLGVDSVVKEPDTVTVESRSLENPETEVTGENPVNEVTGKNLETELIGENPDTDEKKDVEPHKDSSVHSHEKKDVEIKQEIDGSGVDSVVKEPDTMTVESRSLENPETEVTGEKPVNEVTGKETELTGENSDTVVTQEEDQCLSVNTGNDETENSESVLAASTGNEEELDQTRHTESPKFSGLGCEISICGNMLRPGMGRTSAEEIFETHRISEVEFRSSGPSIIKNSNLIVKIDDNYFPWNKAAHIVLGRAVFGPKFSLELKDAIPVEEKEDTIGISPSVSRRWRLWSNPFRMSRSLQRTDSTSSADDLFLDSESFFQSPTDDQASEFGSGIGTSSNNKNDNSGGLTPRKQFVRTNTPTNEQIASLNLKEGQNLVAFSFSTRVLGKQEVDAHIYLWKWNARIVISDVDGTITKSDVLGQFMPLVGKDWTQSGVARLFSAIKENGYQLLFLSARAIVQAYLTRNFLLNLKQDGKALPSGPVVISPDGLFPSLYREVIRRAPHEFKIACLEDIKALFPSDYNPFYAGFGNRDTDELSYRKIGIPKGKIFIINPKGEVAINNLTDVKSYTSLHTLVNDMFPPTSLVEQEDFNAWNYWKTPLPSID